MKTRGQVAQKFKQTKFRHIKREIRRLLKQTAPNCQNNRTLDLDLGPVGVCALDCEICDARCGDRAPDCADWIPRYDAEEAKESLRNFFQTRSVAEISVRFPDVAALLWVLIEDGADDPQEAPLFPGGLPTDEFFGVQVWVDSDEELETLREGSKPYLVAHEVVRMLTQELGEKPEDLLVKARNLQEDLDRAGAEIAGLKQKTGDLEGKVSVLEGEVQIKSEEIQKLLTRLESPTTISESRSWWRSLWPF
jgi:hypothetical protein